MSRALPKSGGALCDVQGYERPALGPGTASNTTMEVPVLDDDFDDDDARDEVLQRLDVRVKAMIGVLEMEFQATPKDIVTSVVTLLTDRDPMGMADHLTEHADMLRTFFGSAPSPKFHPKPRRR